MPVRDDSNAGLPLVGVSGFRVLRRLGRGGMGAVYEAVQESMNRRVALKIMEPATRPPIEAHLRFEQEAWIGGRLAHPNVVKVFDRGVDGDRHYLVMEFVEGGSLDDRLAALREHPHRGSDAKLGHIRQMASLLIGVAAALDHVHRSGIIHRDVKPSNMLIDPQVPRLLLTDFGLARDDDVTRLTRSGDVLGTVAYMSPEQLRVAQRQVDHRSDLWSFGVTLYEAVTLRLPYAAAREEAFYQLVARHLPAPPRRLEPLIPPDLEAIILKCLEHDPTRRYESALALSADLESFQRGDPVSARAPSRVGRMARWAGLNKRLVAATCASALILSSIVVGFAATDRLTHDRQERAYHRYVASQIVTGYDGLLKEHVRIRLSAIRTAMMLGHKKPAFVAARDASDPAFSGEPQLIPLDSLGEYRLMVAEHNAVVYALDPRRHVEQGFAAGIVRDVRGQVVGADGWWFDPRSYLARNLQSVVFEWAASSGAYGGAKAALGVSVAVVGPDGREVTHLREPGRARTAETLPLDGPFEGFNVRVESTR